MEKETTLVDATTDPCPDCGECLCSHAVRAVVFHCLFSDGEVVGGPPKDAVRVEGISTRMGFHKERLLAKRPRIAAMLEELPPKFKEGCSFLELCYDKHGRHWGEHSTMELLMMLGIGARLVVLCLPREHWSMLPGGMPYYKLHDITWLPDPPDSWPVLDLDAVEGFKPNRLWDPTYFNKSPRVDNTDCANCGHSKHPNGVCNYGGNGYGSGNYVCVCKESK